MSEWTTDTERERRIMSEWRTDTEREQRIKRIAAYQRQIKREKWIEVAQDAGLLALAVLASWGAR